MISKFANCFVYSILKSVNFKPHVCFDLSSPRYSKMQFGSLQTMFLWLHKQRSFHGVWCVFSQPFILNDCRYTLLSLPGNSSGRLTWVRLQQPQEQRKPSPTSACWVFSCFRNPRNSDMDCRIFTVRRSSFLCVRIHTGLAHRQRVGTT